MNDLERARQKIDAADAEIKKLFLERMEAVDMVRRYKEKHNLPVRHYDREREIIENKLKGVDSFRPEVEELFRSLIEISCKYQEKTMVKNQRNIEFLRLGKREYFNSVNKVCYQGVCGSYSSMAAADVFPDKKSVSVPTFSEVCSCVSDGECEAGILPIENLTAGSVSEVYDLIERFGLHIVFSVEQKIDHCLLGLGNEEDIKTIVSHPQALRQCSEFIERNKYNVVEGSNTAAAAKETAALCDSSVGVIADRRNAQIYGLKLLRENIANFADNYTRFIVLSKKMIVLDNPEKISMVFRLPHEIGSLARALNDFTYHNINLTKIESRPVSGTQWEYMFFADVEGSLLEGEVKRHLEEIGYMFSHFRIIGNYCVIGVSE